MDKVFAYFQVQVLWILGASIILPLFVSAVQISLDSPLDIFGLDIYLSKIEISKSKWKVQLCQFGIVVLFPLVPAVTVHSVLKEEENLFEYVRQLEEKVFASQNSPDLVRKIVEVKDYLTKTRSLIVGMKMKEMRT